VPRRRLPVKGRKGWRGRAAKVYGRLAYAQVERRRWRVLAGLACQVVALKEDPAPPWRESKAKGASKKVVELASKLVYGACYLS
jgi:hypothetical protein